MGLWVCVSGKKIIINNNNVGRYAGPTPRSWFLIGSIIKGQNETCAQIRGFPRKAAGILFLALDLRNFKGKFRKRLMRTSLNNQRLVAHLPDIELGETLPNRTYIHTYGLHIYGRVVYLCSTRCRIFWFFFVFVFCCFLFYPVKNPP